MNATVRQRQARRKRQNECKRARRRRRQQQLQRRQRRIRQRLEGSGGGAARPVFAAANIHYELAEKSHGIACGGIGSMHLLVRRLGLPEIIDRELHLLKIHLPYHESDHVLNLAYNALAGGTCLEDLELRRNDENYLEALDARRIPDPTTAGDFCRRFSEGHLRRLLECQHEARRSVWAEQPPEFFERATIDMDGVLVPTTGECKQGMDVSYKGEWGYHPLVVSLAETNEVLSIVNRPGNRPSHEGAAAEADRAIELCREAGFRTILLRGDTDFTQTKHLDRWNAIPGVQFLFGSDVQPNRHVLADDLPESAWQPLQRPPRYQVKTRPRARPQKIKEQIVRQRRFQNIRLESEQVAEFDYRPTACRQSYRMIVVKKNLSVEKGQQQLFPDYRYRLYLTNDRERSAAELVREANRRCDQENLNAQLKSGVRALTAPVDTLLSNWAYMLMTALAWNLKAWWALLLPETPGPWQQRHRTDKRRVLRMEFKTFVNAFMQVPCQIVRSGRRLVYRLLAWNPWQLLFFRLVDRLRC